MWQHVQRILWLLRGPCPVALRLFWLLDSFVCGSVACWHNATLTLALFQNSGKPDPVSCTSSAPVVR